MRNRLNEHKNGRPSVEYKTWGRIKSRCYNSNDKSYNRYGGRGIKMCERWKNSFSAFLEDMGRRPATNLSIDRIDVNGDYSPDNCRWATMKTQNNNRRNNIWHTENGLTMTHAQWAGYLEKPEQRIRWRIHNWGSVTKENKVTHKGLL